MTNQLLYISGPYRAPTINGIYRNIEDARLRMEWAWVNGYIPICPHTNSSFIDGLVDDIVILESYLKVVTVCDAILMISGWGNSKGAMAEHRVAMDLGLEVVQDPYVWNNGEVH